MEKEVNTSGNNNHNNNNNRDQNNPSPKSDQSPRKGFIAAGGGSGDRLKRDEWSEGAVSSLLEAYESKWILRNRAKLKGQDWEDVARHVSSRANSSKSPKTQTQCKNKIESMKKRYRSESATATADRSSWPLFSRLDHLLRGTSGPPPPPSKPAPSATVVHVSNNVPSHLALLESASVAPPPPSPPLLPPTLPPQPQLAFEIAQNSQESNGVEPIVTKYEARVAAKSSDNGMLHKKQEDDIGIDHNHIATDSSTPALYSNDSRKPSKMKMKTTNRKRRRRSEDSSSNWEDIADSIRWLAEAVVRSEQARMETMRELERMRVEAEAKRGEMDLKRTEIIANTQLEIAKIFASAASGGKIVDSSLRIGRNS